MTCGGFAMTHAFDRRSFLAGGVALGAGLAALGPDPTGPGRRSPTARGETASRRPNPSGAARSSSASTPKRVDSIPTSARWDEGGFLYGRTVFDPIAIVTAAGKVEPYLAQSDHLQSGLHRLTITLRPGIVFHDGTPLDAAALQLNLEKQKSSILTGPAFQNIAGIQVTGPLTVTVTMNAPWEPFPYTLAAGARRRTSRPPPCSTAPNGTTHPVGTGPFIFKEWVPNSHFTATANPHYWRKGLPYLSSITFKPIIDPQRTGHRPGVGHHRHHAHQHAAIVRAVPPQQEVGVRRQQRRHSGAARCELRHAQHRRPALRQPHAARRHGQGQQRQRSTPRSSTSTSTTPMSGLFLPGSPYYTKTAYPAPDPKGAAKPGQADRARRPASRSPSPSPPPTTPKSSGRRSSSSRSGSQAGMKVTINVQEQTTSSTTRWPGSTRPSPGGSSARSIPDLNYVWWSTTTASGPIPLNMARNSDPRIQAALITRAHLGRSADPHQGLSRGQPVPG